MASFSCGVEMEVCRKCVSSSVIGTKVLGSSTDKGGHEDEEFESFPAGCKIFENFKTTLRNLGC